MNLSQENEVILTKNLNKMYSDERNSSIIFIWYSTLRSLHLWVTKRINKLWRYPTLMYCTRALTYYISRTACIQTLLSSTQVPVCPSFSGSRATLFVPPTQRLSSHHRVLFSSTTCYDMRPNGQLLRPHLVKNPSRPPRWHSVIVNCSVITILLYVVAVPTQCSMNTIISGMPNGPPPGSPMSVRRAAASIDCVIANTTITDPSWPTNPISSLRNSVPSRLASSNHTNHTHLQNYMRCIWTAVHIKRCPLCVGRLR